MVKLSVQGSYAKPVYYDLDVGRYKIGMAHDADIILYDSYVSSYHAELLITDSGVKLTDLGSMNGTYLNGKKITSPSEVCTKQIIGIGNSTIDVTIAARLKRKYLVYNRKSDVLNDISEEESTTNICDISEHDIKLYKEKVYKILIENIDKYKRSMIHTMSSNELKRKITAALFSALEKKGILLNNKAVNRSVVNDIIEETVGLGPIGSFLSDDSITEIMVNGPNSVYIEQNGVLLRTDKIFSSDKSLMNIIERVVTPLGRRIDEGSPMVDARLEDGSRVNAIIPPIALNGPILTIRKFMRSHYSMYDLINSGMLNDEMASFLEMCIKYKKNIIVSGGTGSGKTTLLNVLSNFIPSGERIISIEDAAELQLKNNHVVSLESRPSNTEGSGLVTIRDLLRNALRMRPDRIIVGECRGGEALDMMQAMNTGHEGSLTTCHANSVRDVLSRLEIMMLMSGYDIPVKALREQIASSIDVIIQLSRSTEGKRRIVAISQVEGMECDTILLQDIFIYKKSGLSEGVFSGCSTIPSFYDQWESEGLVSDRNIFQEVSITTATNPEVC